MNATRPSGETQAARHVWFINHYAVEPTGSGGTRHFSLARNLLENDWSSTIFAASTVLNTQIQRLPDSEKIRDDFYEGVNFRWIKAPLYTGNGVGRIANMLAFSIRMLLPQSLRGVRRPDLIIGSTVHPFAAASGAILSLIYRTPFVFEIRDLWPETLIDMGAMSRKGMASKVLRLVERMLCKHADLIVYLPPKADLYLASVGVAPEKMMWLPNGVDYAVPAPSPNYAESRSFTLMYFGAHGDANGLDTVLRAMSIVEKFDAPKRVLLRIVGDGPAKPSLLKLAKELDLSNVSFESPVPKASIPTLASEADAFVFSLRDVPVFRFGISANKLFDYLAAGRPVIYSCNESTDIVENSGAGVCVPAEHPEALAKSILEVSHMSVDKRVKMGRNGINFVAKNYTFPSLANRLANRLNDVLEKRSRRTTAII